MMTKKITPNFCAEFKYMLSAKLGFLALLNAYNHACPDLKRTCDAYDNSVMDCDNLYFCPVTDWYL